MSICFIDMNSMHIFTVCIVLLTRALSLSLIPSIITVPESITHPVPGDTPGVRATELIVITFNCSCDRNVCIVYCVKYWITSPIHVLVECDTMIDECVSECVCVCVCVCCVCVCVCVLCVCVLCVCVCVCVAYLEVGSEHSMLQDQWSSGPLCNLDEHNEQSREHTLYSARARQYMYAIINKNYKIYLS